jgi:phosphoenolpyruvate carboxykinase (GTP)
VPTPDALDWDGLDVSPADRATLLQVDRGEWAAEVPDIRAFFARFGSRLPAELGNSLDVLAGQLTAAAV